MMVDGAFLVVSVLLQQTQVLAGLGLSPFLVSDALHCISERRVRHSNQIALYSRVVL
jgi:hypothetical protein